MSTEDFTLNAKTRDDQGKGASRRLRHDNLVPAIVYGGEKDPQNIAIAHNEFVKHLENEAFYSHIVTLVLDGEKQDVILKDLQRHPAKAQLLHADFLRVSRTQKLTTRVPLHFINEESCKGVKLQGGVVAHSLTELEINCLPQDLPEFIEVDLKDAEIGHIVHISDLNLPAGVESVALSHGEDHDQAVVTINKGRGGSGEEAEGEEEGGEE
ncbi:50S ribosomal protein L25/general stress protein Ctc [Teredinibacter turnerae]|uniref:50S ribosomal protein L25/general stress protein Ctc n=1 Tax=Teredinibacter turnerae TaxID=2426 RepID=UPI000365E2EF|nr:50S ribosomal protein L25/general stress protein Ctc [Teredinibacter turnerae]